MTNFAFIMDLLKISSKNFSEIGFDKSLVSRWRRGKLRLMPNRHIVRSISELFWTVDLNTPNPVLKDVLNIWYPAEPCNTESEKLLLLERFLTEKGQFSEEYEHTRETRLGKLIESNTGNQFIVSKGIESAKLRILDFLDLIDNMPKPVIVTAAYPQGQGIISFDTEFNTKVSKKYESIFNKGHRITSFARSDDAISNFAYSYNNKLFYFINEYDRNKYFEDFSADNRKLFLAVAGDSAAIELVEQQSGLLESSVSTIYTDKKNIERIQEHIYEYSVRSKPKDYLNFFEKPDNYLKYVHISPDSPFYMFVRLPHFGILNEEHFSNAFSLSEAETEFLSSEIKPIMYSPSFYWEYAAVRHIFCESDIENALKQKRHQATALSKLLNRRVWMTTDNLKKQLAEIKHLLETHKNYEVCFLDNEYFENLKVQLAVWGYSASIAWTDSNHSLASRGYINQRIIQGLCHSVWSKIPEKKKSRELTINKIEKLLNL